ncbi:hypothetical protein NC652_034042 [Populus alba x Populus x berolinensis]|nr:hypothetical protein NC652_034042 [Populus alba x Populus x berolinensis]
MRRYQTNAERLGKHVTRLKPPRGKGPQVKNQPIRRHAKLCKTMQRFQQSPTKAPDNHKEDRLKPPPQPAAQREDPSKHDNKLTQQVKSQHEEMSDPD